MAEYRDDDSWLERRFVDVENWFAPEGSWEGLAPEGSRADRFGEAGREIIGDLGSRIFDVATTPSTYNPFQGPLTDWLFKPTGGPTADQDWIDLMHQDTRWDEATQSWVPFTPEEQAWADEFTSGPGFIEEARRDEPVGTDILPWAAPIYNQPTFDPTGTSAPYDAYLGMLEGLRTEPRTGRIQEMYGLGQEEARRRMETADTWEETQGARLDVSDEALDAALKGLQDKFYERMTTIRGDMTTRQAETADLRDGLIEATAGELGPAAAAFMVEATRSGDILEDQRSRNERHMADMDGLYSMWSLDRTMDAAGMKMSARRDLADDVMAMKEMVHEFDYGIQMAHLEALQQAELFSQGQNRQLEQTLAQIGLTRDLAIQSASSEADADWQRANAWLSNPTTGWAFEGMTPEQVMGMSDAQMQMLYTQAVRESEQVEVAPGVFVDAESWWDTTMRNAGQSADPLMNVGGAMLELPTTVPGVGGLTDLLIDQASDPNVQAALDAIAATQGTQGMGGGQAQGAPLIDTSGIKPKEEVWFLDPAGWLPWGDKSWGNADVTWW